MNRLDEPVFTETSKEKIVAVLYQAMFDETIRLRKCHSRAERRDIRDFLALECQILLESESKDSLEKRVAALETKVQEQQEIIDRLQLESCEQLLSQVVHNAQTGSHSPAFQAKIGSRKLFERKTR